MGYYSIVVWVITLTRTEMKEVLFRHRMCM